LRVLFSADPEEWDEYQQHLSIAFANEGLQTELVNSVVDTASVDFIIWSPASTLQDFRPYVGLKAILSLWAGVEKVVHNRTISVPVYRMIDPDLTASMVEWVCGHVLRYHLGIDLHVNHQDGVWRHELVPPLAKDRKIGVLGLGALGTACAHALVSLGFDVAGWSRTEKTGADMPCYFGREGLKKVLAISDILVLLLPATPDTENLLNEATFAQMKPGMKLLNPGRGMLIDDKALLDALATGQVAHATLDVFRQEPLPPDHEFWGHPQITVTPHIAAETRPESASRSLASTLKSFLAGEHLDNVVDMAAGY
jgi:glyoxylate/hydroxypyruvate reductase